MSIKKYDKSKIWSGSDWVNRGGYILSKDPHLSKRLISHGLKLIPREAIAWFNLGIALHQIGKIEAAIRSYRHSLTLPGCPIAETKNNLGQDLLLSGNYKSGWELYEDRLKLPKYDNKYFENRLGHAWQGFSDKRKFGKLILVAEQGLGDTLQFIRFAIQLQRLGISITLFCQSTLVPLLKESSEIRNITDAFEDDELQAGTLWAPLMSLPFKLGYENITHNQIDNYLKVDVDRKRRWQKVIQRRKDCKLIGIHWQGNLKHEGSIYSKGRSTCFQNWLPLGQLNGVEFIALQKGEGLGEIKENTDFPFVKGQQYFLDSMDFRDTASIISICDLIISADSGIVHLAGALGAETWVALKMIPEWRWLMKNKKTHWYRTLKLYRQKIDGDWDNLIKEIQQDLREFIQT